MALLTGGQPHASTQVTDRHGRRRMPTSNLGKRVGRASRGAFDSDDRGIRAPASPERFGDLLAQAAGESSLAETITSARPAVFGRCLAAGEEAGAVKLRDAS